VGNWRLAGKVERFFWTFKWWARRKLWARRPTRTGIVRAIQRRLDVLRDYYNAERVNQGAGGLTPDQAWAGKKRLKSKAIRAHDPQFKFTIRRRWFRGDRHLPVVEVTVDETAAA
jgi:hypothetical protein